MTALPTIQAENGGRPAANDDFLALQAQPLALGLPALLPDMGPCIVSGCRVWQTGTVWNVGPGMVWDGVNLLPYPGNSNVSLPAMFEPGAVQVLDDRAYQDGTTKTTIKGQSMALVPVVAGAPNLVVDTYGALTFWHRVQEKTRSAKMVEWVAAATLANYDTDGVGKPGTEAWGWALVDGQGGRVNLLGRIAVALDPSRTDYDAIGKQGGAESVTLSIAEMPAHNHTGGVNQARFAYLDGHVTLNSATDDSATEPNLSRVASIQTQGSGQAHENRGPFTTLLARVWEGF